MPQSLAYLTPSQAAKALGVSAKALRLYEARGLIAPIRSAAGWRAYGPEVLRQAEEIVALRRLGFSLSQIAELLAAAPSERAQAMAAQQAALETKLKETAATLRQLKGLRGERSDNEPYRDPVVAFDLPWPWGGERFVLFDLAPITFLVGPLFSGKTRLASRLAETLPNAAFLGLDRAEGLAERLDADPAWAARVDTSMERLLEAGATRSEALTALIAGLEMEGPEAGGPEVLIVDLVEQGLDAESQRALIAELRSRRADARPLMLMTRSTAILDLERVSPDQTILFCPANHSPPYFVAPTPGATGYEALASCLASPAVRARSEGVIACRLAAG